MNKSITTLLISLFFISTTAVAQAQDDPHADHNMDHSQHEDHSGHDMSGMDHSGHDMSGKAEDAHASHNMDHSKHGDHSGHDMSGMDHSGHDMSGKAEDEHAGHNMDHSKHGDHSGHNMGEMDHSGHDMSGMDHSGHDMGGMDHSGHDMSGHDHHMHGGSDHMMDMDGGMIMGQNLDKLPSSCKRISKEIEITVRAGKKYAKNFPGTIFAFDNQQWRVEPCSKITWHFVNEDEVRHQFMIHGLPKYLYKNGMFHLEVTGPRTISGTMIVPATDATYLAHCDIAQHMEKGMKAQLVVGAGKEDLPSIPGITPYVVTDTYDVADLPVAAVDPADKPLLEQANDFITENSPVPLSVLIGLLLGLVSVPLVSRFLPKHEAAHTDES